jgi:hypothetical protein
MEKLIQEINRLEMEMLVKRDGEVHLVEMHILSETIARIAIYLTKLAESVSEAELNFKLNRAAKFDRLLKDGEKRTAAETLIRFDQDLIKLEGEVERLRGYIKRCDNVITTIQTHISVKKIEATSLG